MNYPIIVFPSIREENANKFISQWPEHTEIVCIEDNPTKTFKLREDIYHFAWDDIEEELGDYSWIFSKRDAAIKCFGFFQAYTLGASHIISLDDDCLPLSGNFINQHIEYLENQPVWIDSIPHLRTRGKPFRNLGNLHGVVVNMGLWENHADLSAVDQLRENHSYFFVSSELEDSRVMPYGQYFPFCGMNFCFRREATPLMYFPLMGQDQPYSRFDDIWAGIVIKKILDHLGLFITVGRPIVNHEKASDPIKNLVKEAPGIEMNETFWEIIDAIKLETEWTPGYENIQEASKKCMLEIGNGLLKTDNAYLKKIGLAMKLWVELF